MAASPRDLEGAIAANRFGLGARPGEIADAARDPRGFLKRQIRPEGADIPASDGETTAQRLAELRDYRRERRMAEQAGDTQSNPAQMVQRMIRDSTGADSLARMRLAAQTPAGFRERWALFWANHFTVSASKLQVATIVGPYEAEAIRPRVFGRFADLLAAAELHPAMLNYLDQSQSVGPGSQAARFARLRQGREVGLNENLAREILELHTVGVDGGYAQADVTEFARALTGWTAAGPAASGGLEPAVFREPAHEPGARTVMGVRYAEAGREQAEAILKDLAARPQTARFVCTKIARHFVADAPPPALVARLEKAWRASDGDLSTVAGALVDAPEAWDAPPAKLKTPYEFVVSSYRAVGAAPGSAAQVGPILNTLGQRPFGAPSPKGWPDEAAPWAASDALVKRMQFAQGFAAAADAQVREPMAVAQSALGARLSPASATAIARAESRTEALALLLMTPEFQRR